MTLFINSCPRKDSRTKVLANALLKRLGEYKEVDLYKADLHPLDEKRLEKRTALIATKDYSDPMFDYAKEFAAADCIVIAAPYWDLSFPSRLKIYLENIYVTGIVSKYDENGRPVGLCKAKKLFYITTAGGPYNGAYSYGYIKEMAEGYFGISETALIYAEMLDVVGFDPQKILGEALDKIASIPL